MLLFYKFNQIFKKFDLKKNKKNLLQYKTDEISDCLA